MMKWMLTIYVVIVLSIVVVTASKTLDVLQTPRCTTSTDCALPEYRRCPPGCQDPYVPGLPCICTVPQPAITPFKPSDYPVRLP